MEIEKVLNEAGYKTVTGKDPVLRMIKEASDGAENRLCSGYGVFPNGDKCHGCKDCNVRRNR